MKYKWNIKNEHKSWQHTYGHIILRRDVVVALLPLDKGHGAADSDARNVEVGAALYLVLGVGLAREMGRYSAHCKKPHNQIFKL